MKIKLSGEPILWIAFFVLVGQAAIDGLDGNGFDAAGWIQRILIAGGAVLGRQLVKPVSKLTKAEKTDPVVDHDYPNEGP